MSVRDEKSGARGESGLSALLRAAGPRPAMPAEALERVRAASREAWRAKVHARQRARFARRTGGWLAAAAALVAVAGGWWLTRELVARPPVTVATVEGQWGGVVSGSDAARLGTGVRLTAGTEVETDAAGRLAVRLAGGTTVRVDVSSRLSFDGPDRLTLQRGRVYLDSGDGPGDLSVVTPSGTVYDIGTRFSVHADPAAGLRVLVRDGRVRLATADAEHVADAGSGLSVGSDGAVRRESVAAHGAPWAWTWDATPVFELDGQTFGRYLGWLCAETGWRVRWQDDALAREASERVVRGSLAGLRPDQTIEVVAAASSLDWRLDGDVLYLAPASP